MIQFSQKSEYFCMIMIFYLNFLLFLLLKVSDPVFKQNQSTTSENLSTFRHFKTKGTSQENQTMNFAPKVQMKFKISGNDVSQTDTSSLNHQVLFIYVYWLKNY